MLIGQQTCGVSRIFRIDSERQRRALLKLKFSQKKILVDTTKIVFTPLKKIAF